MTIQCTRYIDEDGNEGITTKPTLSLNELRNKDRTLDMGIAHVTVNKELRVYQWDPLNIGVDDNNTIIKESINNLIGFFIFYLFCLLNSNAL